MKVVRDLVGKNASAEELLHYAWGQEGVATALVGGAALVAEDFKAIVAAAGA